MKRRGDRRAARGAIADVQRARLLVAMARAARDLGPGRARVVDVVSRAGVSRRTFYELFADSEQCLLAAIEDALRAVQEHVLPAYRAHTDWRAAIHGALESLLGFLDEDRTFGTLLVVDWLASGEAALARRAQVLGALVDAVDRGRSLAHSPESVSRFTAEGVVGGVLSILHARLLAAGKRRLTPLTGELMGMIVLPYLGPRAVAAERRRPATANGHRARGSDELLASVNVRLTDRTLLVLRVLGEQSPRARGLANAQVAKLAGINDPGQASKLLARLAEHGLLVNAHGHTRPLGGPNAWKLTEKGRRLSEATMRSMNGNLVSSSAPSSPGGARRKPR